MSERQGLRQRDRETETEAETQAEADAEAETETETETETERAMSVGPYNRLARTGTYFRRLKTWKERKSAVNPSFRVGACNANYSKRAVIRLLLTGAIATDHMFLYVKRMRDEYVGTPIFSIVHTMLNHEPTQSALPAIDEGLHDAIVDAARTADTYMFLLGDHGVRYSGATTLGTGGPQRQVLGGSWGQVLGVHRARYRRTTALGTGGPQRQEVLGDHGPRYWGTTAPGTEGIMALGTYHSATYRGPRRQVLGDHSTRYWGTTAPGTEGHHGAGTEGQRRWY